MKSTGQLKQYQQKLQACGSVFAVFEPDGSLRNIHDSMASAQTESNNLSNLSGDSYPVQELPVMDKSIVDWWWQQGGNTSGNGQISSSGVQPVPMPMPSSPQASAPPRQTNDNRATCYDCGGPVKQVQGFSKSYGVCSVCNK